MKAILSKEAGGYDLYRIDEDGKRVTFASTQDYKHKLSLKNCQAIKNGYDLDELLDNITPKDGTTGNISQRIGFVKGFQKALELIKHRLPEETEWDVEIERQCLDPNCDGINRKGNCIPGDKPKLDADGYLILKRV